MTYRFKKNRKNKGFLKARRYKVQRPKTNKYKNPLLAKRRQRRFELFKYVNIVLIIIIFAALYFFIFSSFFTIQNVEVRGNEVIASDDILKIIEEELQESKFLFFKNKNSFLFSKSGLKKAIAKHFIVDNIKITKILPGTLKITIDEKIAAIQWNVDNKKYLLDTEGIVIKEIFSSQSAFKLFRLTDEKKGEEYTLPVFENDFLNIQNRGGEGVSLGDAVMTHDNIKFIQGAFDQIQQKEYFDIAAIYIEHTFPQSVTFEQTEGWKIIFNLNDSLTKQMDRLNILIAEKIGVENLNRLEYIDLKLGESVYFKYK